MADKPMPPELKHYWTGEMPQARRAKLRDELQRANAGNELMHVEVALMVNGGLIVGHGEDLPKSQQLEDYLDNALTGFWLTETLEKIPSLLNKENPDG